MLVGVDGHLAGVIVMADELRPDADGIVADFAAAGVRHVAMVSGDRRSVAERDRRGRSASTASTPSSRRRRSSTSSARLRDEPGCGR